MIDWLLGPYLSILARSGGVIAFLVFAFLYYYVPRYGLPLTPIGPTENTGEQHR